jgi:hypothetical protein
MDWKERGNSVNIETLMTLTQYQMTQMMYDLDPTGPQLDTVMENIEKALLQRARNLLEIIMFIQTIRNPYFFIVFG